jgi:hypothetical protein
MRATLAAAAHALAALAFVFAARDSFACGYCVEDRVAAVYDHAVVVRALERRHEVAFLAIDGTLPAAGDLRRSLESAISTAPGVDRGTARLSLDAAALSFAYDARKPGLGAVMRAIEKKLAAKGLSLSLLRVIDNAPSPSASAAEPRPRVALKTR